MRLGERQGLGAAELGLNLPSNGRSDIILEGENVVGIAFVSFRPEVFVGGRADQLSPGLLAPRGNHAASIAREETSNPAAEPGL